MSAPLKGRRFLLEILAAFAAAPVLYFVGFALAPSLADFAMQGGGTLILKDPLDPGRFAVEVGAVLCLPAPFALAADIAFRIRRVETPSLARVTAWLLVPLIAVCAGFVSQALWVRAAVANQPPGAPAPFYTFEGLDVPANGLKYGICVGLVMVLINGRKPRS